MSMHDSYKLNELIKKWQERLMSFRCNPEIAKGMDNRTALGVQHGRTAALSDCINELESVLKEDEEIRRRS